jgi:hypothetical protein
MNTETIIWLLLVVFMVHDFEEIIMMSPWIRKNKVDLLARFPRLAPRLLQLTGDLSTSAFALAVAIIFISLAMFTVLTVQFRLYALWCGLLLVFSIHFIMHIAQWVILRRYVPVIITSLLSVGYCVFAFWHMITIVQVPLKDIFMGLIPAVLLVIILFPLSTRLAKSFDRWLAGYSQNQAV